jgi:hypothetical protein
MKKVIKVLLAGLLLIFITLGLMGYNIVLPLSATVNDRLNNSLPKAVAGKEISPFLNYDFSQGSWSAYLVIVPEDFHDLHPLISKRVCLKTDDISLLKQMQKSWSFKYNENGDMATVNSTFYLVHDGMIVFETGIMLDKNNQGLQNSTYGWMKPVDGSAMVGVCSRFKKVYWPVVIL